MDPCSPGGFQDYGHTHWADSLFYGRAVTNVTISGVGSRRRDCRSAAPPLTFLRLFNGNAEGLSAF